MENNSKLSITGGKGFAITTGNGVTVSVQFGAGNYCDARGSAPRRDGGSPYAHDGASNHQCENAEIAVIFADGKWHNWGYDDVVGYVAADEVARLIGYCQSWIPGSTFFFEVKQL